MRINIKPQILDGLTSKKKFKQFQSQRRKIRLLKKYFEIREGRGKVHFSRVIVISID